MKPAEVARLLAWGVLGAGLTQLAISVITAEPVSPNGLVLGVGRGYWLVTGSALLLSLAESAQARGRRWSVRTLSLVAVWVIGALYLLIWPAPGWADDMPVAIRLLLAIAAAVGFLGTLLTVLWMLFFYPSMTALAWLSDRVPFLRRHGAGDEIRRQRGFRRSADLQDDSAR